MDINNFLKKTFTVKHIIFGAIVVGLIIALMMVDSCRNSAFQKQKATLDSTTLANQELTRTVNEKNEQITKQDLIIVNSDEDKEKLKNLTLELFDMKKREAKLIKQVNLLIQIQANTGVTHVDVPYLDTTAMKRFSDSLEKQCDTVIKYYRTNAIELLDTVIDGEPAKIITVDSADFQFKGYIMRTKFRIDTLNFPDSQRIAVAVTKGGLFKRDTKGHLKIFKRKTLTVYVVHTNKHINTTGMSSVEYIPEKKGRWLERGLIFAAGVTTAVILLND